MFETFHFTSSDSSTENQIILKLFSISYIYYISVDISVITLACWWCSIRGSLHVILWGPWNSSSHMCQDISVWTFPIPRARATNLKKAVIPAVIRRSLIIFLRIPESCWCDKLQPYICFFFYQPPRCGKHELDYKILLQPQNDSIYYK